MFYDRTKTGWGPNHKKSVLFNGSTYPISELPNEFWNADRMKAADRPPYDTATEKLVGPQELGGGFVGYVVAEKTPEEIAADYELSIPAEISIRQAHLILSRNNLLQTVIDTVDTIGGEAVIEWKTTSSVKRNNPLVNQISTAAGMSKEQIDQMFIDGSKIPV